MGVDGIILIEQVDPFLLLECSKDKLLLLGVAKEEGLSQKGKVELASTVDIVKYPVHEQSRCDLIGKNQ